MDDRHHLSELLRRKRRIFRRKYCIHTTAPEGCSSEIIEAHSVQRSMLEKHLAQDGHVLQFRASPEMEDFQVRYRIAKIGINEATTFFGFCGRHDNDLFRPLETSVFDFKPEQIALLGYRSICRELYLKDAAIDSGDALVGYAKKHGNIFDPERREILEFQRTYHLNARRNLQRGQRQFSEMIIRKEFEDLRYFAVRFADAPKYFSSTAFLPEWDFDGNILQDLRYLNQFECMSFSAWAAGENGAIVFCWHASSDEVCRAFINSLCTAKEGRLASRILLMAFEMSETVVFSQGMWQSLKREHRNLVHDHIRSGVGSNDRTRFSLMNVDVKALPSKVVGIYSSDGVSEQYKRFRRDCS